MKHQLMTLNLPNPEDWRSKAQVAAECGISERTVDRWVVAGVLGEYRIGPHPVYWAERVAQLAAARAALTPKEAP